MLANLAGIELPVTDGPNRSFPVGRDAALRPSKADVDAQHSNFNCQVVSYADKVPVWHQSPNVCYMCKATFKGNQYMSAPKLPLEGSCLCESVQVKVTALPLLTLACHCRDCQKLCASAYSLTAMFPTDGFSVTGELTTGGLRTKGRKHYFCPSCMNFVFSRIEGADKRVNLRASVLNDLTWFAPFVELMTDEKQEWASVPAVRSFAKFPESIEELQTLMDDYAKH